MCVQVVILGIFKGPQYELKMTSDVAIILHILHKYKSALFMCQLIHI